MNVFELNNNLTADYCSYIKSFISIKDRRINELVEKHLKEGLLWPSPLIQLNPSFEEGSTIDSLVHKNILHPECSNIFRINKNSEPPGRCMMLYKHQIEAIENAAKKRKTMFLLQEQVRVKVWLISSLQWIMSP
jgi:ATP-dependent helicase YprA (DUF1998 family)